VTTTAKTSNNGAKTSFRTNLSGYTQDAWQYLV